MVQSKKLLLMLAMFAVVIVSASFVSAAVATVQMRGVFNQSYGNYTTSIEFECRLVGWTNSSTAGETGYNVTLMYNATGGSVGHVAANTLVSRSTTLLIIENSTSYDTSTADTYNFTDLSVSIAALADRIRTYNFSCMADNGTAQLFSDGVYGITKLTHGAHFNITRTNGTDAVNGFLLYNSSGDAFSSYSNFSNNFTLNVSVNMTVLNASGDPLSADAFGYIDAVYFNLSKDGVQILFERAHGGDQIPFTTFNGFNHSFDTHNGSFADDLAGYTICIYVNDTLGNINWTECYTGITFDNNAPSVSLTQNAADTNTDTIALTINPGESGSGIKGSCSTNRGTLSGLGVTASNLNCGESYSFTITCTDYMGFTGSKKQSFSTDACSGGTAGGAGSSTVTGKTYTASEEQFKEGYTKQVKANDQIKVTIGTNKHTIKATSITTDKVTIVISSDPITATLNTGDERRFDVDADGTYDILIKLNSIVSGTADLTVKSIDIEVTEETIAEEAAKEEEAAAIPVSEEVASLTWLWILIIVVVVVVVIYFIVKKKK